MFNKPRIKLNDRSALREFHQQIKLNTTWLSSLGYNKPLYSYDSVRKAILRLPFHLRKEIYKCTKDARLMDGTLNLIMLSRQLKVCFNPLVKVAVTQEIPNIKRTPSNRHTNNFLKKKIHKND